MLWTDIIACHVSYSGVFYTSLDRFFSPEFWIARGVWIWPSKRSSHFRPLWYPGCISFFGVPVSRLERILLRLQIEISRNWAPPGAGTSEDAAFFLNVRCISPEHRTAFNRIAEVMVEPRGWLGDWCLAILPNGNVAAVDTTCVINVLVLDYVLLLWKCRAFFSWSAARNVLPLDYWYNRIRQKTGLGLVGLLPASRNTR